MKKINIPEMDINKMKIFWIVSLAILGGTILFNILGWINVIIQLVAGVFFILGWTDVVLIIIVTFKFANREDSSYLIMLNYLLCLLIGLIVPLMGINTLLLGVMPAGGLFGMSFLPLQIGQIVWTYVVLGCCLGFTVYAFMSTRKNDKLWNV